MGYRSFTDSRGEQWQAWDVVPALADRRIQERRGQRLQFDGDRRLRVERRITPGKRPSLTSGLGGGWLCFEAKLEKRRLTPIPGDWLRCAVERLEQYCQEARAVIRVGRTG